MTPDRFGAGGIRQRVLAAWSDSPARFREDANAEEDLALGGYRDRLVVELAQNAADAAARAGVPGRLLLSLRPASMSTGPVLVAANTGAHLDADGVQALATLRASAKRDGDTIGRFGVGFAAVLAVTDEPAVLSRSGGVRFSAADTRQLVTEAAGGSPGLADELTRRDGHVPVLRLPFAAEGTPPDGYDTAVLLPLRDEAAAQMVERLLDEVSDVLLLALPALGEIVVDRPGAEPLVLTDVADRWHVLHRAGELAAEVLTTRPTEERGRPKWAVTWALPKPGLAPADFRAAGPTLTGAGGVVHAPTPSDEPLPWPAVLIATFPLDPSRRHIAPGPVTDAVVAAAARAYVDLLADRAQAGDTEIWPLVVPGLPSGALDGALRQAVHALLPATPLLAAAEDPALILRPRDAVALDSLIGADPTVVRVLSSWLAGLVLAPRPAAVAFEVLGVRRLALADVVESLPAVADPGRWREVYDAFAPLAGDEQVREALAFLPVPLADGSVARGVRGLLTSTSEPRTASALALLGARIVHPDAVAPLLERLGAVPAGPRALLELPVVRAAVELLDEPAEPSEPSEVAEPGELAEAREEAVVDAVLTLVQAAVVAGQLAPGDLPWLGDLPLPDDDGEPTPAAALALPGSDAARWFADDEIGRASSTLVDLWGAPTLVATGVLDGPGVLRAADVPIGDGDSDGDEAPDLEGWADWCALVEEELAGLPPGAVLAELIAVRDLDLVRREALPEVVAAIAASPVLRPALVTPARIVSNGSPIDVPPYTAWWLRGELSTEGGVLSAPDADPGLRGLLPAAPDWVTGLDPAVQRALGVVRTAADLDAASVPGVLDRLADDDLTVSAVLLTTLLTRLAELAARGLEVPHPARVRGLDSDLDETALDESVGIDGTRGGGTRVVAADRAFVAEAPMYRQRADLGVLLPAPARQAAALADLLDLPLGSELAAGEVDDDGVEQPTAPEVLALLPTAPATWFEHDELLVDGIEVDWWVLDHEVHAATTEGLARGLAWAAGRWELRALVAQVLTEPADAAGVMIDEVFRNP